VLPGYTGGKIANPTYREVCSGLTGHAEVVQIDYDESIVSFKELLEVFFKTHDPTTLNQQGADKGTQYRSAIFYHNQDQNKVAEETISQLNSAKAYGKPIVTEVVEHKMFFEAEEYHKNYFLNNPEQGYCRMVVQPKVERFKQVFANKLK
jgi:peptide-methionine (S)-S-oxide reductase